MNIWQDFCEALILRAALYIIPYSARNGCRNIRGKFNEKSVKCFGKVVQKAKYYAIINIT